MNTENQQTKEPQNKKTNKEIFWQLFTILIIGILFVIIATSVVKFISPKNVERDAVEKVVKEIIKERVLITKPICENNYEGYSQLIDNKQFVRLAKNHGAYAENKQLLNVLDKIVNISGKDEVACGYLYFKASKGKNPIDPIYDSVYIKPSDFGGHILREKSIQLENKEEFTDVLMSLDSIAYLPSSPYDSNAQNFRIANWTHLLNVNSHLKFSMGLSIQDGSAVIEEIIIAYKCWNPETGEETKGCQLSLQ